jgi:uncharacterized membrane protein YgaE (UPF0421/DUF939 family)
MNIPKRFKFVGGRIVKTGIAVFVTAFICHLLNWPAMFAVITAIVTIEPTAADSIKKAFVRFPASAIGAAFAVLYALLFGDSPFSYAFVALSTIIACHKLKLHDGTLVATLTGVAMISTVYDHYVSSFLIRLGTTSTGLIVSTLVNLLILPPNYSETIANGSHNLFRKAGDILNKRGMELFHVQASDKKLRQEFHNLIKEIEKTETLCNYQKDEWRFHRFNRRDVRSFHYECKKLSVLRQVIYHIGNLIYLPSHHFKLDQSKNELVISTIQSLRNIFYDANFTIQEEHQNIIKEISEWSSEQKSFLDLEGLKPEQQHHILPKTVILYELLSINDLTEELCKIHSLEFRHQQRLRSN